MKYTALGEGLVTNIALGWECINSGLDYWNGGMVDWMIFIFFHYLDKALLKSNRYSALHAYIIHLLILHFDKPLYLTIWESSCTKGIQTPTRLGPYTS